MTRIHLHAPTFSREIDLDLDPSGDPARNDLIEAEGMSWVRDGDVDGMPRYVPAAAG